MKIAHAAAGFETRHGFLEKLKRGRTTTALVASMLSVPAFLTAQHALADEAESLTWSQEATISHLEQKREADTQELVLPGRNIAITTQAGNQNSARIRQENGSGYPNLAAISQWGNHNDASIDQQGGFNVGIVHQRGNHLDANLEQKGGQFEALIQQQGARGKINLSQSGSGYRAITVGQTARSGAGTTATIAIN